MSDDENINTTVDGISYAVRGLTRVSESLKKAEENLNRQGKDFVNNPKHAERLAFIKELHGATNKTKEACANLVANKDELHNEVKNTPQAKI